MNTIKKVPIASKTQVGESSRNGFVAGTIKKPKEDENASDLPLMLSSSIFQKGNLLISIITGICFFKLPV